MDNSAQLERERIISLLRAEQKIVDDQLSEMLIERLINKINALPPEPDSARQELSSD